jgi:Type II/IV secretion system protein
MRSFLLADPDVLMVGEMRDHETAAIGIEASSSDISSSPRCTPTQRRRRSPASWT